MDAATEIAKRIVAEYDLTKEEVEIALREDGRVRDCIWVEIRGLEPSELGVISATGKAGGDDDLLEGEWSLYRVRRVPFISHHDSGLKILRDLAATTLLVRLAEIMEIVRVTPWLELNRKGLREQPQFR